MKLALLTLAATIAVLASSSPLAAADTAAGTKPTATAQYSEPGQPRPAAEDTRSRPRRKPSPPVADQSGRGPAFKEECVWVGKRIVNLLSRDDAMAANDFMPFYGQFGCPGDHLARSFGCVVTNTDPSENEALADRIDACWDDPKAALAQQPKAAESKLGEEQPKERPAPPSR